MSNTTFTAETATEALAEASETLRAAGVTGIWLDMSGSGWTDEYQVYVEATTSHTDQVATKTLQPDGSTRPTGHLVAWTTLAAAADAAVRAALAGLVLGERLGLKLRPLQHHDSNGVLSVNALIWPPAQRCRALEAQIGALQAQLALWRRREQYDTGETENPS
jgi:hypothetical protein